MGDEVPYVVVEQAGSSSFHHALQGTHKCIFYSNMNCTEASTISSTAFSRDRSHQRGSLTTMVTNAEAQFLCSPKSWCQKNIVGTDLWRNKNIASHLETPNQHAEQQHLSP